jgi:hypothetical protein
LDSGTSGDRYGECLGTFTIEDTLVLCEKLSRQWKRGAEIFDTLKESLRDSEECSRDINLVDALGIHFESGNNILKFYALRDELITTSGSYGLELLEQMQKLVLAEIENSSRMIELCEMDSRLGFHPEAQGYKYFPEKLVWRIKLLNSLLGDDFLKIKGRLLAGKNAFPAKQVKSYLCNSGKYEHVADFEWKADCADGKIKISIERADKSEDIEFRIFLENRPFYPPQEFILNGTDEVEIPISMDVNEVGFNIVKRSKRDLGDEYVGWEKFTPLTYRLVLADYNPHAMGKLVLKTTT